MHVVAPMHTAACQAQGSTIDKFLLANCTAKADSEETWVIVDEASQVPCGKWGELERFALLGYRFLVIGDFSGQLRPFADAWSDARALYEDGDAIWGLARDLKIGLETYRRGTDEAFFAYQTSLLPLVPGGDAGDHSAMRCNVVPRPSQGSRGRASRAP